MLLTAPGETMEGAIRRMEPDQRRSVYENARSALRSVEALLRDLRLAEVPALELLKPTLYVGPCVYLLHLVEPFQHARHYVGSTESLLRRMHVHRRALSDSCAFMRAVAEAGIAWSLARVWPGEGPDLEYRIKRSSNVARRCPVCRRGALTRAAQQMAAIRARRRSASSQPQRVSA